MEHETGQAIAWALMGGIAIGGTVIGIVCWLRDKFSPLGMQLVTLRLVNRLHVELEDMVLEKMWQMREEIDALETQLRLARENADKVEAERGKLHEQFMAVSAALETQARENTAQAAIIGKLRLDLEAAHRDLLMVTPEQLDKDRKGRE
jgi:septal ring factor EnvC (AmiA/AmiB activator)